MKTEQLNNWTGEFGKEYLKRNPQKSIDMDILTEEDYGISRHEMNYQFFSDAGLSYELESMENILEIGCNMGHQMFIFNSLFPKKTKFYGVEPFEEAKIKASETYPQFNFINSDGFNTPFKSNYFDMVFTSGVLIHINPKDYKKFVEETVRISKKYIWGFEYYSEKLEEINYRDNENMLWKNDFAKMYTTLSNLKIVCVHSFRYRDTDNFSQMFLLEKR